MNETISDHEDEMNPGDDFLEAGFAAMRGRAVPDGPSEKQTAEVISILNAVADRKQNIFQRMNNMKFITGMAASILLVIGAGVAAILMLRSPELTCADVVETVRSARALSFEVTTSGTGQVPAVRATVLINDQGQISTHADKGAAKVAMLVDTKTGRIMLIEPNSKTVIFMNLKNMPQRPDAGEGFIEKFKSLQGDKAKDLGQVEIDGRKAEKFSATQDGRDFVVWADRKTREPIRIEETADAMGRKMNVTMDDFDFNPNIPADEFSFEAPKGYLVQRYTVSMPDIKKGEQNLVETLRGYAQRTGGKFPEKIDDLSDVLKVVASKSPATRPSDADMQWVMGAELVRHFLGTLPKDQWKYLGAGKTTRESGALIFWFKSEKGYRGIYGDLTVKNLPAPPK